MIQVTFLDNRGCVFQSSCHEISVKETSVSKTLDSFRAPALKKTVSETACKALKRENTKLNDQIDWYKATWMRELT